MEEQCASAVVSGARNGLAPWQGEALWGITQPTVCRPIVLRVSPIRDIDHASTELRGPSVHPLGLPPPPPLDYGARVRPTSAFRVLWLIQVLGLSRVRDRG